MENKNVVNMQTTPTQQDNSAIGFGEPNIQYANYNENAEKPAEEPKEEPAINVINANGVISGRKVVDYLWFRIAICAMVITVGCAIATAIAFKLSFEANDKISDLQMELGTAQANVNSLMGLLGAETQEDAERLASAPNIVSGEDVKSLHEAIVSKFGEGYSINYSDTSLNFLVKNGQYRVLSLKVNGDRMVAYEKMSDHEWVVTAYDDMAYDPCKSISKEDKDIIKGVISCSNIVEEETEE